ncbi:methyltransferase domain-containing protein [Streptosporangium sp. NPDC006013]|uniref:methyltransferase domain-containing protein n=1 Tax=Streptosporangium sp. NPDC006013 TaxID=3155596 RepID=UPI0033AD12FF
MTTLPTPPHPPATVTDRGAALDTPAPDSGTPTPHAGLPGPADRPDPNPPTPNAGSYNPATTTAGGLAGELARLEAQAELSFDEELSLLRELGLTASGGPLVEIGAGSGAITRRLRRALPELSLVAVDIDPDLLAHAEGAGAELIVADAADLPLETASAQYVLLRYVLQHLPDPGPALAEARRILRPGGRILVTEVDASCWGLADPVYPELVGVHAKMAATQQAAGGDRTIGRRLTRLLRDAGFTEVALRPFATTNDTRPTDDFAPHLGPGRLQPLVTAGVLSLREFALAADRWNRFRADPNAWVMLLGFTAAGTAPDASQNGRHPTEGIQ